MQITLHAMEDKHSSAAKEMGRWVDQVLKGYHKYCPGETWMPSINLYEDELQYTVVADLAGVNAHEVDLQVEGTARVLSGHRGTPQAAQCHRARQAAPYGDRSRPILPKHRDSRQCVSRWDHRVVQERLLVDQPAQGWPPVMHDSTLNVQFSILNIPWESHGQGSS